MKEIKRIIPFIRVYKNKLIWSSFFMLVVALLTAFSRWFVKPVVDKIFYYKDKNLLLILVLIIPFLYLIIGIFNYFRNYINISVANCIIKDLRETLYRHLQSISVDFFLMRSTTGKTISNLTNDINNIFNFISKVPSVIITDIVTIIGLIVVLFYLSFKFAVLCLFVLPVAIFPIYVFSKKLRYYSRKTQVEIANLYKNLQESISAIVLTKTFGQEEREIKNFVQTNTKVYNSLLKFARTELLSSPIMEFIGALGVAVILFLGGLDVINNTWTPGGFFAFLAASLSFYQPLKRLSEINPLYQQGVVGIERIFEILDQKSSVIEATQVVKFKFLDEISFDNVSFSYTGNNKIIKNINLKIPKTKKVAIVGPSGAGKSTILNLLLRFYDVDDGKICIDGVNIKNFSLKDLRKAFGVVTQDTFLFNETISYNLTYGNEKATDQMIMDALNSSHLMSFINKLPKGLQTVIGERGYTLSGGERQRIAIARAIISNPEVFVFDEPTSALDAESESIVMQAIEEIILNKSKTVVLITHRLNLISDFDLIYVFSNGEIVESGSHKYLYEHGKVYKMLYNMQNRS